VLTHNIMILWQIQVFDRAALSCFLRRKLVIAPAKALFIGLSTILTGTAIYSSLDQAALAACGDGCGEIYCYEANDGTEVVFENICAKMLRTDPPGGITDRFTYTTRFEAVDNMAGCTPAGGLGAWRDMCDYPTGNWSVAETVCHFRCAPED
jgi:hypothetical protein